VKASVRRVTVRIGAEGRPTEEGPIPIHDVTLRIDDVTFPIDGVTFPLDGVTFPLDGVTFPLDGVTFPLDGVTTTSRRCFFTLRNRSVLRGFGGSFIGPHPRRISSSPCWPANSPSPSRPPPRSSAAAGEAQPASSIRLNYAIRAGAERDIDEAADWYLKHALDPLVAVRFLLEIRAVFEMIAESPLAFPEVHRDVRRCRVRP
jgi:ParE toxin of type II toxin-antitoxin system, parDE